MKPNPTKSASFLSGVSILTLSALVVKVMGLLYRIPMLRLLGTEGMGYFNTAYELYALFCVISTAGLPVAMSVLISSLEAEGRWGEVGGVYRTALGLFALIGLGGTALMWGLSAPLASLLGNPLSAACIRAVAPTVLLICLSSAFRGYFQGRRYMVPTAISQVIEAGGKLFLGLAFAAVAREGGADVPTTAARAVLGLTVGTGISALYLLLHKRMSRRLSPLPPPDGRGGGVLRPLLTVAVPVTLSAGVISLTKCVDLALILRRLQAVGYTAAEANSLYGCYSTLAVPVFNLVPSLTTSVALSAVPALSAAKGEGEVGEASLRRTAASALGVTLALAVPAALGVAVYAEDILSLLFGGQPTAVATAAPWLSCLGLSIPAACLTTVTGAMLQAAGRADRPMISMLLGVGCKTALAYVLLGQEGWGVAGVALSSLVCDTVIVTANLLFLRRHAPAMLPDRATALRLFGAPLLSAALAVGVAVLARHALGWQEPTPLRTVATVAAVAVVYGGGVCSLARV